MWGGILKVNKDLGWVLEEELRDKCRTLLAADTPTLMLDISSAEHVCSANLVVFSYTGAMAAKMGKHLLVKVSARAARSFQLAGFHEFLNLEIV